jgi:hypothetical protein
MIAATARRGHPVTTARTSALVHHLPAAVAAGRVDAGWLALRARRFAAASGRPAVVCCDSAAFTAATGVQVDDGTVGMAYLGQPGNRLPVAMIYLNLGRLPDRGTAERVLAHEWMHVCRPALGHKAAAFQLAQQLLDAVAVLDAGTGVVKSTQGL